MAGSGEEQGPTSVGPATAVDGGGTSDSSPGREPSATASPISFARPLRSLNAEGGIVRWLIEAESNSVLIAMVVVLTKETSNPSAYIKPLSAAS